MAQQAGAQHWTQYLKNPSLVEFNTTVNGVNFKSYINFDKGNPFVGNVHPIK